MKMFAYIALVFVLASTVHAQVDNCCGIDRECQTDQQWTDGYWAFQNGHCAAPAQPQPQSPVQETNATPSEVNNCCFVGWECHSNDDWVRGYNAYQENQCGGGAITNTSIINLPEIEGNEWFRQQVLEAFEFLRVNSPKWFNYIASKIQSIVDVPGLASKYGRVRFAQIRTGSRRIEVNSDAIRKNSWPLHNILVHEACHAHQWDSVKYDRRTWGFNYDIEPECYRVQIQALSEMGIGGRYIRDLECFAEHHPFESFCGFLR